MSFTGLVLRDCHLPGQATDEALLRAAKALGADDHLLVESIQEAKNVRSNITTMVRPRIANKGMMWSPASVSWPFVSRVQTCAIANAQHGLKRLLAATTGLFPVFVQDIFSCPSQSYGVCQVLMTAGAQGFTAQEIVDRANALGLTVKDNGPWDKSMRRNAATAVRNSKHLVNIGSSRYAHIAFQGKDEEPSLCFGTQKTSRSPSK